MRQRFTSFARQVQLRVDRFGIKEWVLLIYFVLQPIIWQRCVDGYEYAWNLLHAASVFAIADLAEHLINAYQGQGEMSQLTSRIKEWGLIITVGAVAILLTQSVLIGL